jgi:hypothetical protein
MAAAAGELMKLRRKRAQKTSTETKQHLMVEPSVAHTFHAFASASAAGHEGDRNGAACLFLRTQAKTKGKIENHA